MTSNAFTARHYVGYILYIVLCIILFIYCCLYYIYIVLLIYIFNYCFFGNYFYRYIFYLYNLDKKKITYYNF